MPIPNVPNVWRCFFEYGVGGWLGGNVFHVLADHASDPQDVMQDITDAWYAANGLRSLQAVDLTYGSITVQPYDGVSAASVASIAALQGNNGDGLESNPPAPAQVAGIITLRTSTGGRSGRGRMYIGGMSATLLNSDGTGWNTAGSFQTAADAFQAALIGGSVTVGLCVYSPTDNAGRPVTTLVARETYLGTIRSRAGDLQ